jgi:hypothetical protein
VSTWTDYNVARPPDNVGWECPLDLWLPFW